MSNYKYENGVRYDCCSVGSDESGTGGLFGGCTFAAFKLTKNNLEKLKTFPWFNEITDSKKLSDEKNIQILEDIKTHFEKDKDYCIWNIAIGTYNSMFSRELKRNNYDIEQTSNKIKCIAHNFVHRKLTENTTFHILDNFLKTNKILDYYKCHKDEQSKNIIPIDKFISKGGYNNLSIALASILARGSYLTNFKNLRKDLKIEITVEDNHNPSIKTMEPIFQQIKKQQGKERKWIYCNIAQAKKYSEQLSQSNKDKKKSISIKN